MMLQHANSLLLLILAQAAAHVIGHTGSIATAFPWASQSSRRLEDGSTYEYDLSEFSVRFEKCQYVRMFEDELAEDEDSDSPLAMRSFVVYRLCPSDSCSSCSTTYGSYVVELETYLGYALNYQIAMFEATCENCYETCYDDYDDYTCECKELCNNYENMEALGYVDAAQYAQCQQVDYGDDDGLSLYIGPLCSSEGSEISIGLFADENCWEPYTDLDVEDVLGASLSYTILSRASNVDGSDCFSCAEQDNANNQQDNEDADDVNEMCEGLYYSSGKCESKTGISGFIQENKQDQDYENQVENEFMTCTFIESLMFNSYTETGEIDIDSDQDEIIRQITKMQKGVLALLTLSIVSLLASIIYLHRKIENRYPNLTFMCNTDHQFT